MKPAPLPQNPQHHNLILEDRKSLNISWFTDVD